jgi:plastocyanin
MKRSLTLSLVLAGAAVLIAALPASAAVPRLAGTVGPGFTITLTKNGVRVTSLKAGRYTFVVRDRSAIHNFQLRGPGVNRALTAIGFVGTRTVTVRLMAGRYTFFCVPHPTEMRGTFRVR